jgi:hypothetical protein
MPLDTRLPLMVRAAQPISREQAAAQGFALRGQKRAEDQAVQTQRDQQLIRDLYKQNSEGGAVDDAGFEQGVAQAGLGDRLPDIQKDRLAREKTAQDTQAAKFKVAKERADALSGGLASLLANPTVTHEDVYNQLHALVDNGVISAEAGAAAARGLPGKPEQLRPFLVQQALSAADASKRLEALLPKYDEQDTGSAINQGTIDPLTGTRTAGANVQKSMTPDARATQAHQQATSFGGSEGDLLAALAEQGVSLPAGMRSKEQQLATVRSLIARNPGLSMDEIAYKVGTGQIGFGVDKKETSTAAAISGKIRYAENEIQNIAPLIREASALVPRGDFVPWSKLKQIGESNISDPNLKQLKSYMNTLSNAYDMLAARGGTDQEKRAHNRAMFDSADSPEALEAALQAVENEAKLSDKAGVASTVRRTPPPAAAPSTDVPPDIAALLKKHGSK